MNLLLDYRPALRDRTGVGEWVHQLAISLLGLKADGDPDAAGVALTLWSSSWRDRPAPSALRELNGATFVDRRVPVGPLTWAWNRVGWPPIEALTSRSFDVVHSTTPLLMPARSGLRVCTIYDLDFLSHPDRTRREVRRDYPRLVHAHTARANLVVTISEYSKRQIAQRLSVAPARGRMPARHRPGSRTGSQAVRLRPPPAFVGTWNCARTSRRCLPYVLAERLPSAPPSCWRGRPPAAEAWVAETQSAPPKGCRGRRIRVEPAAGGIVRRRRLVVPSLDEGSARRR
jgi:hypothetical protein